MEFVFESYDDMMRRHDRDPSSIHSDRRETEETKWILQQKKRQLDAAFAAGDYGRVELKQEAEVILHNEFQQRPAHLKMFAARVRDTLNKYMETK